MFTACPCQSTAPDFITRNGVPPQWPAVAAVILATLSDYASTFQDFLQVDVERKEWLYPIFAELPEFARRWHVKYNKELLCDMWGGPGEPYDEGHHRYSRFFIVTTHSSFQNLYTAKIIPRGLKDGLMNYKRESPYLGVLFLDEAHAIKSPTTVLWQQVHSLCKDSSGDGELCTMTRTAMT